MFYVRKLSKPPNLQIIQRGSNPQLIPADFIGQEMRTAQNTLSVWRCESLDKEGIQDAIKAALFSSSTISATQFLILDSDMLDQAGIKINDTRGKTSYKGLNHLHSDLCELTYEKIGILLQLYNEASQLEKRTPKVDKQVFQKIAIDAYHADCLDEDEMDEHFKNEIHRLIGRSN